MKITVDNGIYRDHPITVEVELPCSPYALVSAFVKAYVKHATTGSLVSDDVLFSSIGAAHVKESVIGGSRANYGDEIGDTVENIVETSWNHIVLMERYGNIEGTRKSLELDGVDKDDIEKMMAVIS